eukprot:GEMP01016229.1.p1 GENE.GEMP01016229.1~~GEMP01016229.1.p1  ORF type:complete len:364 (+),score=68.67 GEMP01016229.1:1199-2290(+)
MNFLDWVVSLAAVSCQVLLTIVMKYVLSHGFPYPLFCTAAHLAASFILCFTYIDVGQMLPTFKSLGFRDQMTHVMPVAVTQALSIGLSNVSLLYLFPSFVSMMATLQPLFTLLLSLVFVSDTFNMFSYAAMVPIIIGSIVLCTQEHTFHTIGFLCILGALALRALKQVLQARLLCGRHSMDALTLLYYVAPYGFVIFILWSFIQEGPTAPISALIDGTAPLKILLLIVVSALVAAAFNILSFIGVERLNATLWSLLGQLVTPLVALSSWLIFANVTTVIQIAAFTLASMGVYIYNQYGRVPHVVAGADVKDISRDHGHTFAQYGTVEGSTMDKAYANDVNANDFDIEAENEPLKIDLRPTPRN